MTLQRSCPVCGVRRARPVWAERATTHRVVRCAGCACVFSDASEREYEAARHNAWDEDDLSDAADLFYRVQREHAHERFLAEAARQVSGRRILDVGCGLGVFLERAQARGWDVHGIDTSASWVAQARERVGGHRVSCGLFQDSPLAREQFDVITLWDVIEHVWDPLPVLRAARAALAPGGTLFLRTPNARYVLPVYRARRAVLREDLDLGAMNHVIHFSSRSLGHALRRTGFGRTDWRTLPPPQVPVGDALLGATSVRLKNAVAAGSDALARRTGGRVDLGSDLDVFAWGA